MSQAVDALSSARDAASRQAWREAYETYSGLPEAELTPTDLEGFADAAWWNGKLEEAIRLRERAYAGYSSAEAKLDAARIALALAWDHGGRGAFSVSQGWFANVERLLGTLPEAAEHGQAAFFRGFLTLSAEGSVADALGHFERAYELAQRAGDRDTQVLSLIGQGRAHIQSGEVDRGLALLDEATAAAVGGQLRPFSTGLAYCVTIRTCQDVGDFRRAAEWTEAASRWCDGLDVTGFPGACRVHRAEILRLRGDWPAAERQALAACEELQDFEREITAAGYYEVGEIRRRRGDFATAEEAYREANAWGHDPQPGLALLRLAEGKVESAVAGVRRALENVHDPFARVRVLPAQIEIALAAGDLASARAAAAELEEIVDSYKIGSRRAPAFDAIASLALGQISLADRDWDAAVGRLRQARDDWQQVGAPYEIAQSRMLLGLAYRRSGDEDAATGELEGALATFERLGAKLDEARAKELLGRLETRRTFLFTDIVDSTKLLETLGDEKWRRLLARHDELVRGRIVESGGDVIKHTGDGFFASFEHPRAAIEAAIAIQRALSAEIVAPDVRIGAHTGGAFHTDADFRDYGGQGVHTAARIGAAAQPGEILISRETIDGVGGAYRLSEPRAATLKGFEDPVEVVSVDWR